MSLCLLNRFSFIFMWQPEISVISDENWTSLVRDILHKISATLSITKGECSYQDEKCKGNWKASYLCLSCSYIHAPYVLVKAIYHI